MILLVSNCGIQYSLGQTCSNQQVQSQDHPGAPGRRQSAKFLMTNVHYATSLMRARSGHRPSFFCSFFSSFLLRLFGNRLFPPLAFRGKQTFFFFHEADRTALIWLAHRDSGTRALFPMRHLTVNMEMTTLSASPFSVGVAPVNQTIR